MWDKNVRLQTDTEVRVLHQADHGLYTLLANFVSLARDRLQLNTPPWYDPRWHLRLRRVTSVGRSPSNDALDGFWARGGGCLLPREADGRRWSSSRLG